MTVPRLHLPERLAAGRALRVEADRAHYLRHVLRLRAGAPVHLFNAEDGEWRAEVTGLGRRELTLTAQTLARAPAPEPGPTLVFAPIKRARLDWLVEKAVELGAARLVPVVTARTVVRPDNLDRLRAVAVEAAEQCERLTVPALDPPRPFDGWLAARDGAVPLCFADERAQDAAPLPVVLRDWPGSDLLVGPEGGFTAEERERLRAAPGVVPVRLGDRILRAETAALYALVCWQACSPASLGDVQENRPGSDAPSRQGL
jgi:16S rRNA (uracil1498-N3)-methyltransferase